MTVFCVWGGINFSVFEVDSLQEQENWKEQMLILEHVLPDKCKCVLCVSGWCVGINFSVLRLIVFKLW